MKASRYNLLIPDEASGQAILFNTLAGSLALLDPGEIPKAKAVLADPARAGTELADLAAQLTSQRFLVPDELDELSLVRARKIAGIRDRNRLDLVLMPTLNCNFACPYCYEEHTTSRLSEQTRTALQKWMSAEIPKHKLLLLSWFGGEPLLAFADVLHLTRHALDIAARSGASFIGHVTTNGYALDARRIRQLVDCELHSFQITLDGTRAQHDRTRALRNGRGTFDRVFRNILDLVHADDRVTVTVRINFNHENLDSIPDLLGLFPHDVRSRLGIEMEPVFGDCRLSAVDNLPAQRISKSISQYCQLAEAMGFRVHHGLGQVRAGKLVYCYAERQSQFVINYNGDVFKCSVCRFRPEERVGYLAPDGKLMTVGDELERFVGNGSFNQRCESCVYLPLCMGGCRSARLRASDTGSFCALVPTNTTFMLKQVAFNGLNDTLKRAVRQQSNAMVE